MRWDNVTLMARVGRPVAGSASALETRIGQVLDLYESRKAAAEVAGRDVDMLRHYETGKSTPPLDVVARLCVPKGIRLAWLWTGDGPMTEEIGSGFGFAENDPPRGGMATPQEPFSGLPVLDTRRTGLLKGMLGQVKGAKVRDRLTRALEGTAPADSLPVSAGELGDGFVLVPQYDIQASAGAGRFFEAEQIVDYLAFKESWVRRTLRVAPSNLALIHAVGESMEPVIRSGDLLLIDTSVTEVLDDTIYVVIRGDYVIVKRLQRFFNGAVSVKSANPAYSEETLTGDELKSLKIVGRVVWVARQI
ncbi:MAG: hypothetical protein GC150_17215 [Rhizobiales bacterium]|nr:hypothetical protein [Hyphomicrobiales bacterium]